MCIRDRYRAHRDGAAPCCWAAKCRTSPSISSGTAAGTRVAAVSWRFRHHFVRACFGLATWRVWRYERRCGGDRTAFRGADAACRGASCGSWRHLGGIHRTEIISGEYVANSHRFIGVCVYRESVDVRHHSSETFRRRRSIRYVLRMCGPFRFLSGALAKNNSVD